MGTLQTTSFPVHPARFPFARGVVLGALLATSLSALLVQASGADGIFGDYFTRMIRGSGGTGMCPTGKVITGFSVNTSDYGTPICDDAPGGDGAPIGTIAAFNSATCPAGWSPANGTSGTPDLRGEFIRGLDGGRGIDTGRGLGTWQKGTIKAFDADSINATYAQDIGGDGTPTANDFGLDAAILSEYPTSQFKQTWINSSYQGLFGFSYGVVRPRNVALLYCMKTASAVATPAITWGNTNATTPANGNVVQLTTGNVGIGTNSPAQKLDIVGNTRITGTTTINGIANISNANIGKVSTNELCLSGNCKTAWDDPKKGDVLYGKVVQFNNHNNYWDEKGSLANIQLWNNIIWYQAYDPSGLWKRTGQGQANSDWLWNECNLNALTAFPRTGYNPDAGQVVTCGTAICEYYTGQYPFMSQLSNLCAAGNPNCNNYEAFISWNCLTK